MYSFLHFIALFTFCEFFSLGTPEEYYLTIILAFIEPEEPPYSINPFCATAAIQGSNNKSPTSQFETKNEIFKLRNKLWKKRHFIPRLNQQVY